jgi:hypothetical protein
MRKLTIALALVLAISGTPSMSSNHPKIGSKCTKLAATQTVGGQIFKCTTKKGKLVWTKAKNRVSFKDTTPPKSSPRNDLTQYESPSVQSLSLDKCMVKETSFMREPSQKFSGFPSFEPLVKHKGVLNYIVVPVDWIDVPGQSDFRNRVKSQIGQFESWVSTVSEGKLKINWKLHEEWIRLPGKSQEYTVPFSEASPQTSIFWQKVTSVVDPVVDFSGIDVIIFLLPLGQKVVPEGAQELYPYGAITEFPLKEGKPVAFMAPGFRWDELNVVIWSYLAHELGHLLGFAHFGTARMGEPGDFRPYEVMGNQDLGRTFSGWWRFLTGWLEASQVFCTDLQSLHNARLSLVPIDESKPGVKLVAVRISESEVVLIESRRRTNYYNYVKTSHDLNGVVAYKYNSKFGHLEEFFSPLPSFKAIEEFNWDGRTRITSKPGDKIETPGLRIEILASGDFDKISLERLPDNYTLKTPIPGKAPIPSKTDFNIVPEVNGGGMRTSETTGESIWYARYFNSYRIFVKSISNPNSLPMFDTGIVNDFNSPIKIKLTNLTCNRDEIEVAIFYSGKNGQGQSVTIENPYSLSAANLNREGKCVGYWSNNGVRP